MLHRQKTLPTLVATLESVSVGSTSYSNTVAPTTATAANNTVTVISLGASAAPDFIFGGWHGTEKVSKNTVIVKEAVLDRTFIAGGMGVGATSYNTVDISSKSRSATPDTVVVYGGYSHSANSDWNTVSVTNRYVTDDINGGYIGTRTTGTSTSHNSVVIDNSKVRIARGGFNQNDSTGSGTKADGNTVTLKNGSFATSVIGGTGEFASGNTINIQDSTVTAEISAGVGTSGEANNTVSISGKSVLNNAVIVGGMFHKTGNTLQMHTSGVTAGDIANFENLHFYLPNNIANGDTVLTLDGQAFGTPTDITGANIGVAVTGGKAALQPGDRITLINAELGLTADAKPVNNTSGMKGIQGVSLRYGFDLSTDPNNLYATVNKVETNPQAKTFSEGRAGGLAFINQGADLLSNAGIAYALEAAQTEKHLFSVISGGNSRYKSGSHVDVKGVNLLAGASTKLPNSSGNLLLTGFFEAGWGNYDSFNNFTSGDVRGKGNASYYGLGLLARQEFNNQLYTEASVRTGRVKSDFSSTISGQAINFEQTSPYYGAHLGLGYLKPLRTGLVDMYGKYFWARVAGKQSSIAGDTFSFSDVNSHRTRLGARYHYPIDDLTCMKIGAAWEYDFDGKAAASVHNLPLLPSSIKGHTGTVDAGIKFSPSSNKNLSFEANIQGHWGKRQGVSGNVVAKYIF